MQFVSSGATMFATFRWTKTSPDLMPTISFADTRLSEQPIHMYFGCWMSRRRSKNCGSSASRTIAQARFRSSRCVRDFMAG